MLCAETPPAHVAALATRVRVHPLAVSQVVDELAAVPRIVLPIEAAASGDRVVLKFTLQCPNYSFMLRD